MIGVKKKFYENLPQSTTKIWVTKPWIAQDYVVMPMASLKKETLIATSKTQKLQPTARSLGSRVWEEKNQANWFFPR